MGGVAAVVLGPHLLNAFSTAHGDLVSELVVFVVSWASSMSLIGTYLDSKVGCA